MKYNCHVHIFHIKSIPENFLGKGLISFLSRSIVSFWFVFYLKKFSKKITAVLQNIKWLDRFLVSAGQIPSKAIEWLSRWRITRWLANILNKFSDIEYGFIEKYAAFVEAGRHRSPELLFNELRTKKVYNATTRFVVLSLDMDYMGAGNPACNYLTQLSYLYALKKKHPDTLLPFVSIDPRRGNAKFLLDFAKKHIEELGFIGIKLYPALGFYPFDPRLMLVYDFAQQNGVPIMTHCTQGGVFYKGKLLEEHLHPANMNPSPVKKNFRNNGDSQKNSRFKNYFSNPENYKDVLELFPRLKICLAHFGGSSEVRQFKFNHNRTETNWYLIVKKLCEGYANSKGIFCENVYTDISYTLADKKIFDHLKADINHAKTRSKILFGTDFYMTLQEKSEELLIKDFLNSLTQQETERITSENPMRYLESAFYNPYNKP